jgi:hypothetical protein
VLKVDVHELVFDDCLIGMSYVKDFTIWNRSEMPLVFNLDGKQEPALEFTDFETGLPGISSFFILYLYFISCLICPQ